MKSKKMKQLVSDISKKRKQEQAEEVEEEESELVCKLSEKRLVTVAIYNGIPMISIRDYYSQNDKECPTKKGINLTKQQWSNLRDNISVIEKAIKKVELRDK